MSALTTPESALMALARVVGACLAALVASVMRLMICSRPLPDSAACVAARASLAASSACSLNLLAPAGHALMRHARIPSRTSMNQMHASSC